MTEIFNFTQLSAIYSEAWLNNDHTISFEIKFGKGRFVFIIFFSPDDKKKSGEFLFIYLRNTNAFIKLKLYGSRQSGDFKVYINDRDRSKLISEMQLSQGDGKFDFLSSLKTINNSIPESLPLKNKIDALRVVWNNASEHLKEHVDQAERTVLIGVKRLPDTMKPKEKTLRKLYFYTNGSPEDISNLIRNLKSVNYTLVWSSDETRKHKPFIELINDMR